MSIFLRKRKNNDGSTSLVLDIYHNGKRRYEFLKELKLMKPTTAIDRQVNKERIQLAEAIKNKRELQLQGEDYEITPAFKKTGIDFIKFFEAYLTKYTKKDKRVLNGCLTKFKEFMIESNISFLTTKQVNEALVTDFKEYLEAKLHGETPANYFKKLKKVLKFGVKEGIFSKNPANELTVKRSEGIAKEILTYEEIGKLAQTPCTNEEVKRAFLFSCLTGSRFCDVINLKAKNINGNVLKFTQQKTQKAVSINLNEDALHLLKASAGGKSDTAIFKLPSHTACLKDLRVWCKNAGITKKITWHCARHSFATNIIFYGSDVNSASALLGHSSLTYTQRYVRVVDSLKEKAVQNLPKLYK